MLKLMPIAFEIANGVVKWNLDGSVIARDSLASCGCVLRDDMGRWITGAVRNIGVSSITTAELWAFKDASRISLLRGIPVFGSRVILIRLLILSTTEFPILILALASSFYPK
ncbi:hypothetical protein SESBI_03438 [Sesbania bispinosa]|nr:hypothetical protein SESBI_03438 [Sesbania bispinosa]